jgi:flagellar basal body-associated protein FliL
MGMVLGIILVIALAAIMLFFVFGSNVFRGQGAAPMHPAQSAPAVPADPSSASPSLNLNPTINVNPPAQK